MTNSKGKSTTQYLKIIRAWPRIKANTDILKNLILNLFQPNIVMILKPTSN